MSRPEGTPTPRHPRPTLIHEGRTGMWVMSSIGFFSIVKVDKPDATLWQVRARERKDLVNLRMAADLHGQSTSILTTNAADYCYRIIVDEEERDKIMLTLGELVDYPN